MTIEDLANNRKKINAELSKIESKMNKVETTNQFEKLQEQINDAKMNPVILHYNLDRVGRVSWESILNKYKTIQKRLA